MNSIVPTAKWHFCDTLWRCLCFWHHVCLFTVWILLLLGIPKGTYTFWDTWRMLSQSQPKMPPHLSNDVWIVTIWDSRLRFIFMTEFRWDKVMIRVMTKFMRIWQGHTASISFFPLKIKKNNSNALRAFVDALYSIYSTVLMSPSCLRFCSGKFADEEGTFLLRSGLGFLGSLGSSSS